MIWARRRARGETNTPTPPRAGRLCRECGQLFPTSGRKVRCVGCTRTVCIQCGVRIESGKTEAKYCSRECCGLAHKESGPRIRRRLVCVEPGCESKRTSQGGLCTTHHRHKASPDGVDWRQHRGNPEHYRKAQLIKAKRRRAKVRGLESENVDRDEVGRRDGWRCGICHRKINQRLVYPHLKSASLDHVIPLAAGGVHTYANSRIAHLDCNVRRGTVCSGEQLALI